MATMTQTDLMNDVIALMQIGYKDVERFRIDTMLNLAQAHIVGTMPAMFLTNCARAEIGNLTGGAESHTYPQDFVRILQMWVSYSSAIATSNPGVEVQIRDDRTRRSIANLDQIGTADYPVVTLGAEGGWTLFPVPQTSQTNGWRMQFIRNLPDISATQVCLLSKRLRNLMVYRSAEMACRVNNYRADRAAEYRELYREERSLLIPKHETSKEVA